MKKESAPYYPIFLNVRGRKCVVVGGGEVAWRKVEALLEHGAKVDVVSPDLCPGLEELAGVGQIRASRRSYRKGDLKGALIAIAATDDQSINRLVASEAREIGVLVNVVDDPASSDFIVPSRICRGDVTIAISTAGKSPALARKLRTRIEKDFGEEYAALSLLVAEVRAEAKQEGIKVNGDGWQEALDLEAMIDLLKKGEREKARAVLLDNLKAVRK